jgi:integrase
MADIQQSTAAVARSTIAKCAVSADRPVKPYEVHSERVRGLLLRVQPSGKRTYYVQLGRGKRVRIGGADIYTLKRAEKRATDILLDPDAALPAAPAGVTLREYVEGDYTEYVTSHNKKDADGTLARVLAAWAPLLDRRISDINVADVELVRTKRLKAGKAKATVNRDVAALSGVLAQWSKSNKTEHPLHDLETLDEPDDKRVRYLSKDEAKRLRQALADRDGAGKAERERYNDWCRQRGKPTLPLIADYCDHLTPMVLLSLNTGMRRGELFGLTWEAVDVDKKLVAVRAETSKGNKTRFIPLNPEALDVLTKIKPVVAAGLVFKSPKTGGKFDNVKKAWEGLTTTAKLTDVRWHDMRHDFASQLVMRGVSLYTVQTLMGHGSSVMTQRYAHLQPDHLADAVAALGAA